jgi:hypothetical protein
LAKEAFESSLVFSRFSAAFFVYGALTLVFKK